MTKWFKILTLLILVTVLITLACQSGNPALQSNSSNTNSLANTLVIKPKSNIHSKVCGAMNEIKYIGEDVKTFILSQPMPEMWIVEKGIDDKSEINCDGAKINLSDESKKFLQQHWQDRLEYNFLDDFVGPEKGMEAVKRDTKLSKSFLETKQNLEKTPVTDGDSQRNITPEEADELVIFLRDASNKVTQSVKRAKQVN